MSVVASAANGIVTILPKDLRDEDVRHPFVVVPAEEGGYVIYFPDLPGCMTQVDDFAAIPATAQEIYDLWIETVEAMGESPVPAAFSGGPTIIWTEGA